METNERNDEAKVLYQLLAKLSCITSFCDFRSRTKTYSDDIDYVGDIAHDMIGLISARIEKIRSIDEVYNYVFPFLNEDWREAIMMDVETYTSEEIDPDNDEGMEELTRFRDPNTPEEERKKIAEDLMARGYHIRYAPFNHKSNTSK